MGASTYHGSSGILVGAPALGDSVHPSETVAAAYVQSANWKFADPDESCPEDSDDGHADHIGCCGGVVSCASGCGAAIPPDEPLQLSALKAALACSMTPVSVGAGTTRTDPPPLTSI